MSTQLRMSTSTLWPLFLVTGAAAAASAVISAWAVSSAKDAEITQMRQARDSAIARAAVLEVLARNAVPLEGRTSGQLDHSELPTTPEFASNSSSAPVKGVQPAAGAASAPSSVSAASAASAASTGSAVATTAKGKTTAPPPLQKSAVAAAPAAAERTKTAARQAPAPQIKNAPAPSKPAVVETTAPSTASTAATTGKGPAPVGAAQSVAQSSQQPVAVLQEAVQAPTQPPIVAGAQPGAAPAVVSAPPVPATPQGAREQARTSATNASTGADRIVLVPAAQLGVSRIEPGAVVMLSGKRVRVGEAFESGEVLREADPARNRIVTDQRTVGLL